MLPYLLDVILNLDIVPQKQLNDFKRPHHGRMIAAAEPPPYFGEAIQGELPRQIHRDLPRPGDTAITTARYHVDRAHAELLAYSRLYVGHADALLGPRCGVWCGGEESHSAAVLFWVASVFCAST